MVVPFGTPNMMAGGARALGGGGLVQDPRLQRRGRLAEMLLQQGTSTAPVASGLEGLARVAQAALGSYDLYSADREYRDRNEAASGELSRVMSLPVDQRMAALEGTSNEDVRAFATPMMFSRLLKDETPETFGAPQTERGADGRPVLVRYGNRGGRQVVEGASPYQNPKDGLVTVGNALVDVSGGTPRELYRAPERPGATYSPVNPKELVALGFPQGTVGQRNSQTGKIEITHAPSDRAPEPLVEVADPTSPTGRRLVPRTQGAGLPAPAPSSQQLAIEYDDQGRPTVSMGGASTGGAARTIQKTETERLKGLTEGAADARRVGQLFSVIRDVSQTVPEGVGAQMLPTLGRALAPFGIQLQGASDGELMNSLTTQLAVLQRAPGSGATTDFEMRLYMDAVPRLGSTRAGNLLIADLGERLARRRVEENRIADDLIRRTGSLAGLDDALDKLGPVFSPDDRRRLMGISAPAAASGQGAGAGAPQVAGPPAGGMAAPSPGMAPGMAPGMGAMPADPVGAVPPDAGFGMGAPQAAPPQAAAPSPGRMAPPPGATPLPPMDGRPTFRLPNGQEVAQTPNGLIDLRTGRPVMQFGPQSGAPTGSGGASVTPPPLPLGFSIVGAR